MLLLLLQWRSGFGASILKIIIDFTLFDLINTTFILRNIWVSSHLANCQSNVSQQNIRVSSIDSTFEPNPTKDDQGHVAI